MSCCIMEASPPSRMRNVQKSARYVAFRLRRVDRVDAAFHVTPAMQQPQSARYQYTTSMDARYKRIQSLIQNHMLMCALSLLESRE